MRTASFSDCAIQDQISVAPPGSGVILHPGLERLGFTSLPDRDYLGAEGIVSGLGDRTAVVPLMTPGWSDVGITVGLVQGHRAEEVVVRRRRTGQRGGIGEAAGAPGHGGTGGVAVGR